MNLLMQHSSRNEVTRFRFAVLHDLMTRTAQTHHLLKESVFPNERVSANIHLEELFMLGFLGKRAMNTRRF